MYVPLKITTDFSLLKSLIKIDDLISYLTKNNIKICAICDDFLYGSMEFYNKCLKNGIKPIIGLDITIANNHLYLYAKNYQGYQNLLKLNTIKTERELGIVDLSMYKENIIVIIPTKSISLMDSLTFYQDIFVGFYDEYTKNTALLKTKNIVYIKDIRAISYQDTLYLKYLDMMRLDGDVKSLKEITKYNYLEEEVPEEYQETTSFFASLTNLEIPKKNNYIPKFTDNSKDFLTNLSYKGLNKRLQGTIPDKYQKRLDSELEVINNMGFNDYILIVYDYVLHAKKNNILVGPGRGSAAGSLLCYAIGITDIDPLKYNLLFERFLNKDRVTMPDIDIDFENTKRMDVIAYLKEKYGFKKVASIMTFATLKSKLALREVAKILLYTNKDLDYFLKNIDASKSLLENYQNEKIKKILSTNKELKKIYKIALKLENIKKNISTHAAGVVISSTNLDDIIPIIKNEDFVLTGVTSDYLEDLGLLKMDLLAIKNLTMIANTLDLIEKDTGKRLNLNKINLNDLEVLSLFKRADTIGIFQFESDGMVNFLSKLKPTSFEDLVLALAIFRPGPMQHINDYIKRREGKVKIDYIVPELKPILEETKGIIVYQEQVMEVLRKIGNFTFSEADLIRRAMSKKKESIILESQDKFIKGALANGYSKDIALKIYDLVLKFASFGFNKSHSVSYALVAYQMAYLKVKFYKYFITNLLNMNMGSIVKTNEYLIEAKKNNIKVLKPSINLSDKDYYIKSNELFLPFGLIKGLSSIVIDNILEERKKGKFTSFINFVTRLYKNINKNILITLINAGVFDEFYNKTTLLDNLDIVLNYAEIASSIENPVLEEPEIEEKEETVNNINLEMDSFGFFITNHPVSIYNNSDITKLKNISNLFDKYIKTVVLVDNIKIIKTKNNENMAFITASDEEASATFVVFARQYSLLDNLNVGDIIEVQGRVTKRLNKYQINVNNLIKK